MPWQKPNSNKIKLNVDVAVSSLCNNAAVGGLIRNSSGVCLDAFNASIGPCSPLFAEIWEVQYGLKRLLNLGMDNIIIESDSLLVVSTIL